MDAKELEQYDYQLTQVNLALSKDPTNQQMLNLKSELENLIDLTKQYLQSVEDNAPPSNSTGASGANSPAGGGGGGGRGGGTGHTTSPRPNAPSRTDSGANINKGKKRGREDSDSPAPSTTTTTASNGLVAGSDCLARTNPNGKFLPARITSVGGTPEAPIYSVAFKQNPSSSGNQGSQPGNGNGSTNGIGPSYASVGSSSGPTFSAPPTASASLLTASDVKPLSESKKRALALSEEQSLRLKKKLKSQKRLSNLEAKSNEQNQKQTTWQSFTKKAIKKGVEIPGVTGGSMFKSPEEGNVKGRVGVVGSGKGMSGGSTGSKRERVKKEGW